MTNIVFSAWQCEDPTVPCFQKWCLVGAHFLADSIILHSLDMVEGINLLLYTLSLGFVLFCLEIVPPQGNLRLHAAESLTNALMLHCYFDVSDFTQDLPHTGQAIYHSATDNSFM